MSDAEPTQAEISYSRRLMMGAPYVIRLLEANLEVGLPPVAINEYLATYDPEGNDGLGIVTTTPDVEKAMQFDSFGYAFATYYAVPHNRQMRPDGKLNRPLTGYTIEIIPTRDWREQ